MDIAPAQRNRIADICRRYHVRRLSLFGSTAVGTERPDSDVDLLVEFIPGEAPSGFELVDMQQELSAEFDGRRIDIAFPSVLDNPFRRRAIEPQLRPIYQQMDRTAAHVADMAQFAHELRAAVAGKHLAEVLGDRILCQAIEKLFINLGEAAKRVSPEAALANWLQGVQPR